MRRSAFQPMMGCLTLFLVSCSVGEQAESEPDVESTPSTVIAMSSSVADAPADDAFNLEATSSEEAEIAASTLAGDLTAYVGKFPFDEIGGVTWHDHPMVSAGIRNTVTDTAVLNAMQASGGPSAPIATYKGKVGSWGCQQHNCGDHQWAVLVDPNSGATDVCYHNAEQTGEASRWYLSDGSQETRPGNCSVV